MTNAPDHAAESNRKIEMTFAWTKRLAPELLLVTGWMNSVHMEHCHAANHYESAGIIATGEYMKKLFILYIAALVALPASRAADAATLRSIRAAHDISINTDPTSRFWASAGHVYLERNMWGDSVSHLRTKVLSRWTNDNLYFLFICPYEELDLKPNPNLHQETDELWKWDVAEVFIGWDFENVNLYKEFEVSPQGEWIDLDIDLKRKINAHDRIWNSGFSVAARIDRARKIWYGAMRIPFSSIDPHPPKMGTQLRINLFRSPGPGGKGIAWQPTMSKTFHVPDRFGILKLVDQR